MISALIRMCRAAVAEVRCRRDPIGYARSIGVQIGNDCRLIRPTRSTFGSEPFLITIGNDVTVGAGVRFLTHDGGAWLFRHEHPDIEVVAPITIGNSVFIGTEALLMPGITVGDHCVIGAGAVVTRDVPSGWVVAGVPAKQIKTIEEYRADCVRKSLETRRLSPAAKAEYFKEKLRRAA